MGFFTKAAIIGGGIYLANEYKKSKALKRVSQTNHQPQQQEQQAHMSGALGSSYSSSGANYSNDSFGQRREIDYGHRKGDGQARYRDFMEPQRYNSDPKSEWRASSNENKERWY